MAEAEYDRRMFGSYAEAYAAAQQHIDDIEAEIAGRQTRIVTKSPAEIEHDEAEVARANMNPPGTSLLRRMYNNITFGGDGNPKTGRPGRWESPVQVAIPLVSAVLVLAAPLLSKSEAQESPTVAIPTFPATSLVETECPITGNDGPTTLFTCYGPTASETDNTTVLATPLQTPSRIRSLEVTVDPPGEALFKPTVVRGGKPHRIGNYTLRIGNQGEGRLGVTEQIPVK